MIPSGTIELGGHALSAMRRLREQMTQPGTQLSGITRRDLGEIMAIALKLRPSIDRTPTDELVDLIDMAVETIARRHTHPTVPFIDDVGRHLKIVRDDISRLIGE